MIDDVAAHVFGGLSRRRRGFFEWGRQRPIKRHGPSAAILADYQSGLSAAHAASARIAASQAPEAAESANYLLPLATRVRSLFKMDFAEAQYIIELRSGPAGLFSYRRVAWEMYLALRSQHPALAKHIRVTDFTKPIDLLKR